MYKLFKLNPKLSSVSGPVMLKMPEKEPMMLSMSLVVVVIMLVSMFLVMFYVGRWYLIYTRKNTRKKVKKCLVTVEYCSDFNIYILLSIILGIVFLDWGKMSSHQTTHLNLEWTGRILAMVWPSYSNIKHGTWQHCIFHSNFCCTLDFSSSILHILMHVQIMHFLIMCDLFPHAHHKSSGLVVAKLRPCLTLVTFLQYTSDFFRKANIYFMWLKLVPHEASGYVVL